MKFSLLMLIFVVVIEAKTSEGVVIAHEGGMGIRQLRIAEETGRQLDFTIDVSKLLEPSTCWNALGTVVKVSWKTNTQASEIMVFSVTCPAIRETLRPRLYTLWKQINSSLAMLEVVRRFLEGNRFSGLRNFLCDPERMPVWDFPWLDRFVTGYSAVPGRSLTIRVSKTTLEMIGSEDEFASDKPIFTIQRGRMCLDSVR